MKEISKWLVSHNLPINLFSPHFPAEHERAERHAEVYIERLKELQKECPGAFDFLKVEDVQVAVQPTIPQWIRSRNDLLDKINGKANDERLQAKRRQLQHTLSNGANKQG